jgi:uncharacterized protein (DUF2237 family)
MDKHFSKKYLKYKIKYDNLKKKIKDDSSTNKKNILGTLLVPCCATGKVTGFYRDGICSTGPTDSGTHIVCAIVDNDFLKFTKSKGNDLITPTPYFPGLVSGDKWCLCILRWIEAYNAGKAPKIIAESTNKIAEEYIDVNILLKYAL